MASSRIARFATEVAPPQIMSVMRNRTSKILDTINEDDREISVNDSRTVILTSSSPGSSSAAASPYRKISSCLTKKFQRAFTLFGNWKLYIFEPCLLFKIHVELQYVPSIQTTIILLVRKTWLKFMLRLNREYLNNSTIMYKIYSLQGLKM